MVSGFHMVAPADYPYGEIFQNPAYASVPGNANFSREELSAALGDISRWPGYAPTPLAGFPRLASALEVGELTLKLEAFRLGVGSFKALGPPYALVRVIQDRLRSEKRPSFTAQELFAGAARAELAGLTVVSATSGNHGRAVAWACAMLGCGCVIVAPEHTGKDRLDAIAALGADVRLVPGTFDDAADKALELSQQPGWIGIVDNYDPRYPSVQRDCLRGYSVIGQEIVGQCAAAPPTHVFLSAGSGAMAAGISIALSFGWPQAMPRVVVVEPVEADALLVSARAGAPADTKGSLHTVMDALAVRAPSPIAWPILRDLAFAFLTIPDETAVNALRLMARGACGDPPTEIGDTGIAATAAVVAACLDGDLRALLGIDRRSRILAVACEGVTDLGIFKALIGDADHRTSESLSSM